MTNERDFINSEARLSDVVVVTGFSDLIKNISLADRPVAKHPLEALAEENTLVAKAMPHNGHAFRLTLHELKRLVAHPVFFELARSFGNDLPEALINIKAGISFETPKDKIRDAACTMIHSTEIARRALRFDLNLPMTSIYDCLTSCAISFSTGMNKDGTHVEISALSHNGQTPRPKGFLTALLGMPMDTARNVVMMGAR